MAAATPLRERIAREVKRQLGAQRELTEAQQKVRHFEAEIQRSAGALSVLEEDYLAETGQSINDGLQADPALKALVEAAMPTAAAVEPPSRHAARHRHPAADLEPAAKEKPLP